MSEKVEWVDAELEIRAEKKAGERGVTGCVRASNAAVLMAGLEGLILHCAETMGVTAMQVVARVAAGLAAMEDKGDAVDQRG